MHELWMTAEPDPNPLLEDPIAEMMRQILAATLDTVHLYVGDKQVCPNGFSFIGIREGKIFPIWEEKCR
ncbi:MAG: hypothetical protein DDT20_01164 [Firmicutes bacterium]|nr:hypothetical protein [Bacillota bacterium]